MCEVPATTLGACRMPPHGTSSRTGSPNATPVTATEPSRRRLSSSSHRSSTRSCSPSTTRTRRVGGPDSRPTTDTQAGKSPANSTRGGAGASLRTAVWPAASPSLTIGIPVTGSDPIAWRPPRSSAKGGRRSRVSRATTRAEEGSTATRRVPSQSSPPTRISFHGPTTSVAPIRSRERSAVPRSSSEPVGTPARPPDSQPAEPVGPATGGDGRRDPHLGGRTRPDAVSLVRLRSARLLAEDAHALRPMCRQRAGLGRRAGRPTG